MLARFRPRSQFIRDVFSVGLTQILVYLLAALLLRVMANWLGTEKMGAYLVTRRFIEITATVALLNLGVSLARYVALHPTKAQSYLSWGVLLMTLVSLVLILLTWLGGHKVASLVLGELDLQPLVLPAILFLTGALSFTMLYAYLRGRQQMARANGLQLVYYATLLVIAFGLSLMSTGSLDMLVVYLCIGGLVTLVIVDLYLLREGFQLELDARPFKELMRFGLPRLPSGFLLSATFSAPMFMAARQEKLEAAAFLGISQALIKLFEPVVMPISIMLLPKIAELVGHGDQEKLKTAGLNVISAAIYVATFVSVMVPGLSPEVIYIWFGEQYLMATPVAKIVLLAIGPYLAYVILRGVLDAVTVLPIVTLLTTSSAISVIVASYFVPTEMGLAWGLAVGLFCLGGGAVVASAYWFKVVPGRETWVGLGLVVGGGGLIFWIDRAVISLSPWPSLAIKLSMRAVLAIALVACLWYLQVPWFTEMMRRLPLFDQLLARERRRIT